MNRRTIIGMFAKIGALLGIVPATVAAKSTVAPEQYEPSALALDKVEAGGYFIDAEHAREFLATAPIRIVQSQTHGARAQVLVSYWADLAHTDLKDDVAVTCREDFAGDVEAIRERFIKRVRLGARIRGAGEAKLGPRPLFACIKCYSDG